MVARIWVVAAIAIACGAATARAQEGWREERHERMERLHRACEAGDDRACRRLRQLRHEWREREEWRERHEGREHERDWGDRPQGPPDRY